MKVAALLFGFRKNIDLPVMCLLKGDRSLSIGAWVSGSLLVFMDCDVVSVR